MSGCKKNNDLQIDYPSEGQYGENILDKANTNYSVGSNSMRVVLGAEAKIKIKIKSTNWYFDMNLYRDWEVSEWNYKDTSRLFTSIKTGETDSKISLRLSSKTRIVVYENGDTIPTWSKDITVQ